VPTVLRCLPDAFHGVLFRNNKCAIVMIPPGESQPMQTCQEIVQQLQSERVRVEGEPEPLNAALALAHGPGRQNERFTE
jgi:hypothetical protein